jgi:hypothetical protein
MKWRLSGPRALLFARKAQKVGVLWQDFGIFDTQSRHNSIVVRFFWSLQTLRAP